VARQSLQPVGVYHPLAKYVLLPTGKVSAWTLPEKDRWNDLVISLDDITSKDVLTGYILMMYNVTI